MEVERNNQHFYSARQQLPVPVLADDGFCIA
jgi:hypothetical protein